MTWILILTMLYSGEHTQIVTVEFTSQENCQAAKVAWMAEAPMFMAQRAAICVKK